MIDVSGTKGCRMTTVHYDCAMSDDERRERLFAGDLFVYSARQSVLDYVRFTCLLIDEAFGGRDPEHAQFEMTVEDYAELLGRLKPQFIHHPLSKRHLQAILAEFGCDAGKTYFDVPRMRSSTSDGYLTTGIAYAWHPHRDTWYSAPQCQVNWWTPVFDIVSENAMAFHPGYWNRAVENSSAGYNYYEWNKLYRGPSVSRMVTEDPRPLPRATEHLELEPQLRLLCPVGGMILFSGAQMHSSVPNTSGKTRFSIDFRTVHLDDVGLRRGAPKSDERCTGTTMRDYLRATDFSRIPDQLIASYDDDTADRGCVVYEHAASDAG
jgi:hypothetical protein